MSVPTLQTKRLLLRAYTLSDVPDLVRLIGAQEVAANTLRIPHPYAEADAKNFLVDTQESSEPRFAITFRVDNRLCGGTGLRLDESHRHAELGYWIGLPYWGHGYATEAARAMLHYGFEVLKLHRIFASHFGHNPASGKVLRKIGMRYEGCFREHVCKSGQFIDLEMYGMLAVEWIHLGRQGPED